MEGSMMTITCCICLDEHRAYKKTMICDNGHALHMRCFTQMACITHKTSCPLCQAFFSCPTCGDLMLRSLCLSCYVCGARQEEDPKDELIMIMLVPHLLFSMSSLYLTPLLQHAPLWYNANQLLGLGNSLVAFERCFGSGGRASATMLHHTARIILVVVWGLFALSCFV